ncbi:MAG: peptidase LD-carboxypeptidase [Verrucomicrobiales bacterium]|nr:peptidase LD-carboxypeptidase [Verrucomicrobiales bacterium]
MRALKPGRLREGELIGFVSPASAPLSSESVEKAVRYVEGMGYRVKLGSNVGKSDGYLAGTDEERASDVNAMFADPEVRAIFAIRGGYGTPRILPLIDYESVKANPKIFAGFSDITALQLALLQKTRLVTFSSPMPAVEFANGTPDPFTSEHFWRLITTPEPVGFLANPPEEKVLVQKFGHAAGLLLAGNLSLIVSLLGTPYWPKFSRSILLIEEVDEYPHKIDRMLMQLQNCGILKNIGGLLIGKFTHCEPKDPTRAHLTTETVLDRAAQAINGPVFHNLQYGHVPRRLTMPIGLRVRMDGAHGSVEIIEAAVL